MLTLINRYQLAALAPLALGSLFFWPQAALSVLMGGIVMASNFFLLRFLAQRLLRGGNAIYALALVFKFIIVVAAIGLLMTFAEPHPWGFLLGMLTLFIGIALAMVHRSLIHTEA